MKRLTIIGFWHKETREELDIFLERLKMQTCQDFDIVIIKESNKVTEYKLIDFIDDVRVYEAPYRGDWGQTSKYNVCVAYTDSEFVCFPNVDSHYEDTFIEQMLGTKADLAYCDMDTPAFVKTTACVCGIDVGGFIVKRRLVLDDGWTDKSNLGDGRLVERIVKTGCLVAKVDGVLYHKR